MNLCRIGVGRFAPLFISLLLPILVTAQVPHTFNNGEAADADKINQNFSYVLENASGGCTVEQVDNSAEITCADGSSAFVPGYGTVLVSPQGTAGETPDITAIPTGAIVAKDANDVLLGEVIDTPAAGFYEIAFYIQFPEPYGAIQSSGMLLEIDGLTKWVPTRSVMLHYLSSDCSGMPFANDSSGLYLDENLYYSSVIQPIGPILTNSRKRGAYIYSGAGGPTFKQSGACETGEFVFSGFVLREYTPAPEILNAAYPVRLEQLP